MRLILPIIVIAQFFCTSLWFAGNSIIADMVNALHLDQNFLPHLTSAIQLGFISGTLVFAVFAISDRFSPSMIFFISSLLAALFNLGIIIKNIGESEIVLFRLATGFFLAGIYPVGMKIASDHFKEKLGKSLGFLVGALVLGTAFPHFLKNFTTDLPWQYVIFITSGLSILGGISILLFVPNGPFRTHGQQLKFTAFMKGFRDPKLRAASFGYFGHMWELYSFWAFLPVMLSAYNSRYAHAHLNIPLLSFLVIASGALACILSGLISQRYGPKRIAIIALSMSCLCCLLSPFLLFSSSTVLLIAFLFVWGISVIADSPLFSTLVAQSAPPESRGSSLTIVNCIGFSITIVSIQCIGFLTTKIDPQYIYLLLAIGPILGLIAFLQTKN